MKDKTSNSSDVKEKSKKGRYSLKKLLDRSRFSPSLLFLSKSFASKSTEAPNEEQRKSVHDDMMEINANIRNSASSSPHSYSPDYRRRLTASVPFDCSDSPIITTTEFRNPACGSDQASPNSEYVVEEEYEESLTQFADIILGGFKSRSNPSSRKSPDSFSAWSDAALQCGSLTSGIDAHRQHPHQHHHQHQHPHQPQQQQHQQVTETSDRTPPPIDFSSYEKSADIEHNNTTTTPTIATGSNNKASGNIVTGINPSGIYNEPCDAKPSPPDDNNPMTIYTTRSVLIKNPPVDVNRIENSPPYHDNYINHMDHYHCNCTENVNSSGPVTATTTTTSTTTPMNNNPCTVKTESFQGRNEQSMSPMLSCVSPIVNSETHVISNSIGIQMKNNSNNSNSQPSVSFASSPRGNTVITHHPSSPFARVPRGPILKNEGNLKMPVQFSQPSTGSRISTYSTVDGDTVTATSTSASASAYSDNLSNDIPIPITDASTNGSSVISNESPLDSSKSSSKQSVRVNESQRTNSVYYESSQPAYTDDKIKSVGALTSMHNNNITTANNNNNPMGTGRGRPNVSSSYPTYEEAWDVKLARQLGVGVSRLPSILPISPTTVTAAAAPPNTTATPNHIPSLPSFPTGGGATPSQNSSSVCNKAKLTDDNVQTVETDFKALNITTNSSDDKSAKMTNFSEMLITDNKNVYDDDDDACNYKNKNNGKSVNGINQLFYHNEPNNDPSQRNSISSHMVNGKTELTENSTGEYDYAYNGSWNMGVKYNLNLAINNSSNDSSIIPTTPKYTNTPTTGITKTVKSSHCSNTIHSSNPHHTITSTPLPPPPPPAVPSHHHRHHPHSQKYGISSSQSSQESSRLSTVRNDTNDFKGRPASRPIPSVIPNDLDSISTDSCDESWDARHGQLVSELMRGRFIDPSVIVPTTSGKMMNPVTTTATGMTTESLYPLDKNVSIIPGSIPATTTLSSCTSSSSSTPSSSSSPSSSSTSASTASSSSTSVSHVVPLPSPLPSQCINTVPQLSSDQFNPSNGLRYPGNSVNKTKLSSSSQNNLPKGLPANLENLPLEEQPWFHPSLTRSEAEELIRNEPEGSFLVRPSETCPNDFSLTIKHKSFLHMRISRNSAGQYILGEYSQPYTSVSQMIYHYARTLVPVLGAYSVTLTHPVLRRI